MIEKKIIFTVIRVKYTGITNDICRASIRINCGCKTKTMDISYQYAELKKDKEYEAVLLEEGPDNSSRVKDIIGINNISNFIKESLSNDKNISNEVKENMTKSFGGEPIECLMDFLGELIEAGVLSQDKAKYIADKAVKYNDLLEIREYCKSNKITELIANTIYMDLGVKALVVISCNPYILVDYGVSLKIIDVIASGVGLAYNDLNRVKCGAIEYSKYCSKEFGHVFTIKKEIIENLNDYMNKHGGFQKMSNIKSEVIEKAIVQLKENDIVKVYINKKMEECIYLRELFECEVGIADIISKKLLRKIEVGKLIKEKVENFIRNYSDRDKKLTDEQSKALRHLLTDNSSLLLLRGYPGTGKTETLRAIVSCINTVYNEVNVAVIGFTGKVIAKVKEVIPNGTYAKTIHSYLGLIKGKKFIPEEINVDFLIIEESTLMDTILFYNILQTIKHDTRILLLGDTCQLSSIGPGACFNNLIKLNLITTIKLTKIFRQGEGSTIINNIHKMAEGIGFSENNGLICKKGEFELVVIKKEADISERIKQTVNNLIKDGNKLNQIQILSAVKEHEGGTKNLNKIIQNEFNPNPRRILYNLVAGDIVMQNVNNCNSETFNGEMGMVIENIDDSNGRKVIVKYRDKIVEYKGKSIKELDPAFAMTIHKAQGSEFEVVVLCLLRSHKDMLNLNMLYTACSRAKKRLIIITTPDTFDTAIKKVRNIRNSNLVEMIIDRLKEIEEKIA